MADVFISYKSERRNAAQHLKRILELHGYSVWFDYALLTGRDFARQIETELTAAKAVVVLWCARSVQSEWVINEAYYAKEHAKFIPVWIEQAPLPFGFQRDDTINLTEWDASPRSPDLDRLFDQIAHLVTRDPVPDMKGLREHEANWKMFGAPSLATFALDKDLEAERARREEEERQRKAEEDIRLIAEQERQRELAERERKNAEERDRFAAAEKQRLEDAERAKQAELLVKKREAEQLAQRAEELRQRQQAEAERQIKDEDERRQREAAERSRIEELARAAKAQAERKSTEALQIVEHAIQEPITVAVDNATAQGTSTEAEPVAIPKPNWMSNPTIRYGALAVLIVGGGATISSMMGIFGSNTPVPREPDVSYRGASVAGLASANNPNIPPLPSGADTNVYPVWEKAHNGDRESQNEIGIFYRTAKNGFPKNAAMAEKWYLLSANQGYIRAQYNLGLLYRNGGDGVLRSDKKAEAFYLLAANSNYANAQNNLGYLYFKGGDGVPSDGKKAEEWLNKAVAQDNIYAVDSLAELYEVGAPGIQKNLKRAIEFYKMAAGRGNDASIASLARLGVKYP